MMRKLFYLFLLLGFILPGCVTTSHMGEGPTYRTMEYTPDSKNHYMFIMRSVAFSIFPPTQHLVRCEKGNTQCVDLKIIVDGNEN